MQIVDHSAEFKAKLEIAVDKMLKATADDMAEGIRRAMKAGGKGTPKPAAEPPQYGWVRARSAAGDAPAMQTGKLLASIGSALVGPRRARVGSSSKVGYWTQYGTPGGKTFGPVSKPFIVYRAASGALVITKKSRRGTVAPRPWLSNAVDGMDSIVRRRIREARL